MAVSSGWELAMRCADCENISAVADHLPAVCRQPRGIDIGCWRHTSICNYWNIWKNLVVGYFRDVVWLRRQFGRLAKCSGAYVCACGSALEVAQYG